MSAPDPEPATLLDRPEAGRIPTGLLERMRGAVSAGHAAEGAHDPPEVVASMLEALALLDADGDTLAAALLHTWPGVLDALGGPKLEADHPRIAGLLEGQRAASPVWALHAEREEHHHGTGSEGLRRLLLAIVRDLRVVPILLARQLARMQHATAVPEERRLALARRRARVRRAAALREDRRMALARLTRDNHAALANRLGIWQLKWQLEGLAFRYLHPDTYKQSARLLDEKRADRERYIREVIE